MEITLLDHFDPYITGLLLFAAITTYLVLKLPAYKRDTSQGDTVRNVQTRWGRFIDVSVFVSEVIRVLLAIVGLFAIIASIFKYFVHS